MNFLRKPAAALTRSARQLWSGVSGLVKPDGASYELVPYSFAGLEILMPKDHRLGIYQTLHPLYDRFLPHLAKYLPAGSIVVDVGANVGDTLAAMYVSNTSLAFVCIEPDDEFFPILRTNAGRITSQDELVSITLIKSLVGASVTNVTLKGAGGTKKAVQTPGTSGIQSETIDDLLEIPPGKMLALLKSDVDGYDYDVINSAHNVIDSARPLLFFECQLDHAFQKTAYERLISELPTRGYNSFTVFDNFGEVVMRTNDAAAVIQLFNYVWRQNAGRASRTVYYYDILVGEQKHDGLICSCIADYVSINMPVSTREA